MKFLNKWQMSDFNIQTPIGRGTIVGMTPDHANILVMHTYSDKKGTYAKWWLWDEQKGEIVGEKRDNSIERAEGNS